MVISSVVAPQMIRFKKLEFAPLRPSGWVPANLNHYDSVVRWINAGDEELRQPFFFEDLAALRGKFTFEAETDVDVLRRAWMDESPVQPAGLIFHVSRCGSTLVSNALRHASGVTTVAEAQPFQKLIESTIRPSAVWQQRSLELLPAMTSVFSRYRTSGERKIVVKCGIREIAALPSLRRVWPRVPVLILIRDPTEVVVSNLQRPARWLLGHGQHVTWFGQSPPHGEFEQEADFVAWVFGRFCATAKGVTDQLCKIIDYEDLTPDAVCNVAQFFGLNFSSQGEIDVGETFLFHSKARQPFVRDSEEKHRAAGPRMKESVLRWAALPYAALRESGKTSFNTGSV
jgi:hypothetical protein